MSIAASRSPRGRRGRVLVVGFDEQHHAALPRIMESLAQPPSLAANMFEALGEVVGSSASEPIAAALISDRLLSPPHARAIESLRRIDPSVRIVAVSRDPAPAALPRCCDAWLSVPFGIDDLRRALDDDGLIASANAQAASTPPVVVAASAAATLAVRCEPPHTPGSPDVIDLDEPDQPPAISSPMTPAPAAAPAAMVIPADSPSAPAAPAAAAPAEPIAREPAAVAPVIHAEIPPTPAGDIGDTDLIHAMLHDSHGLLPLALRLIARHGGWTSVQFDAGENPSSTSSDGVEVLCASRPIGRLRANPTANASTAALRAWADWLGHWLHLEREHRRLLHESRCDELTGAWNRRHFHRFLADAIARARPERRPVTLMVFDIDNFKSYNDRFGHQAGDDILCEIVRLLKSVIRGGDIVCRIGGDEFAVVFADPEGPRTPGSTHPESVESIARRFQKAVASMHFPKLGVEALGTLSVSAGLSSFPWDGQDPAALLRHADERALASKRKGKNALTFGPGSID